MSSNPPVVLIVDGHQESLALYAIALLGMGFNPVTAENAEVAFARACQVHPDAVVTDIALPDVSGFELMRRLRDDARTQAAGIIGLSEHLSRSVEETAYDTGCDRLLKKPCMPDALGRQIRDVLASRR